MELVLNKKSCYRHRHRHHKQQEKLLEQQEVPLKQSDGLDFSILVIDFLTDESAFYSTNVWPITAPGFFKASILRFQSL